MNDWTVTLASLLNKQACISGYNKLVCFLTGAKFNASRISYIRCGYEDPIPLLTILESNGLRDALWATRCLEGKERDLRMYAVWCARRVQHLMSSRCKDALDVATRFADGKATKDELRAACAAAHAADDNAAYATTYEAACDAAYCAILAARYANDAHAACSATIDDQEEMFRLMVEGKAPWQINNVSTPSPVVSELRQ